MIDSLQRMRWIAANTFLEAVRQKFFNALLLLSVALVASSVFFQQFDFGLLFGFELKVNSKLAFDVRYKHGLLNFNNSTIFDGNETERIYKNRTVNYGAVYKF